MMTSHSEDDPSDTRIPFSQVVAGLIAANDARPMPKLGYTPSAHTQLVRQTMQALARLPGAKRIRKRQVGRFIATDPNGGPRKTAGKWHYVKVAHAGDADIEMNYAPPGHKGPPFLIALEVKTGAGRLSPDQIEKRDAILALGGHFVEVRSAAQAFEDVLRLAR